MAKAMRIFTADEVLEATFVSASPTRSGRQVQARFRIGETIRSCTKFFTHAKSGLTLQGVVGSITRGSFYIDQSGRLCRRRAAADTVLELRPSAIKPLISQVEKADEVVKKLVRDNECAMRQDEYGRQKARSAMRGWMLSALRHGVNEEEIHELVRECVVHSVQYS